MARLLLTSAVYIGIMAIWSVPWLLAFMVADVIVIFAQLALVGDTRGGFEGII